MVKGEILFNLNIPDFPTHISCPISMYYIQVASIILLDSPVGTGFSYARHIESHRDVGDFSFSMHVVTFLNKVKLIYLC